MEEWVQPEFPHTFWKFEGEDFEVTPKASKKN